MLQRVINRLRASVQERVDLARAVAGELVEDAEDRWHLVREEAGQEAGRWIGIAIASALAAFFGLVTLLWTGLTIILLYWDTPHRHVAIWGVFGFWAAGLIASAIMLIVRLKGRRNPFELSRRVLATDLDMLRRNLRHRPS